MIRLSSRTPRFYAAVSLAAAVLAAVCLLFYLQGLRSRIAESGRLVRLVVAARDLGAGEVLDTSCLELVDFPDAYLLPGTFTDTLDVTGAMLRSGVGAGEPLLASSLLGAGGGSPSRDSLDPGFRAYPLPASSVSFPAGELHAGNRVDILSIRGDGAFALLEDVEVLYVLGAFAPGAGEGLPSVTTDSTGGCILLQLTREEACRLAYARKDGEVELLLRGGEI